jgi:hypothetical protein
MNYQDGFISLAFQSFLGYVLIEFFFDIKTPKKIMERVTQSDPTTMNAIPKK